MQKFVFLVVFIFVCFLSSTVKAQPGYAKIADESIGYIKAGTFGKPDVIKKTNKIGLGQVRVHYKFVTTQAAETRSNGARVSVYLTGGMTNQDLQNLTDEFYRSLQQKLGALGIEFTDWDAIKNTEYYTDRQAATDEKRTTNGDVKSGQGWLSFTAYDGPVFMRYGVVNRLPEIVAYGKAKKLSKMCETMGADLATFDVVLDFTSIGLSTGVDTTWIDGSKYLNYKANSTIAPIMSVPESFVTFYTAKNKFDYYNSKLPVVTRDYFSGKPYEDANKASLQTRTFFGEPRFIFTPVVIEADRKLYLAAARNALNTYADVFVEKMRLLRAGEKPSDSNSKQVADTKGDGKMLKQVTEEAKKNNDTTAVTYGEMMQAGKEAEGKNNVNLAIEYYSQAIKQYPDRTDAYMARMLTSEKLKNWDSVTKDSEAVLKIEPNNLLAKYALGTSYFFRTNYKKSAQILGELVQSRPDFLLGVTNYGLSLAGMKKFGEAEQVLSNGIASNPRDAGLYRARAAVYKVQGRTDLAQADELRAVQIERGQ